MSDLKAVTTDANTPDTINTPNKISVTSLSEVPTANRFHVINHVVNHNSRNPWTWHIKAGIHNEVSLS
jgi:hypothetical protein